MRLAGKVGATKFLLKKGLKTGVRKSKNKLHNNLTKVVLYRLSHDSIFDAYKIILQYLWGCVNKKYKSFKKLHVLVSYFSN